MSGPSGAEVGKRKEKRTNIEILCHYDTIYFGNLKTPRLFGEALLSMKAEKLHWQNSSQLLNNLHEK